MPKILTNLLLFLAAATLSLLCCEATVRVLSRYLPKIAFLSSIGKETPARFAASLEDYVKTPEFLLTPHGQYNGCKSNALGFYDVEFNQENTATVAIGDSFLFGRVSYPDNVITRLEGELVRECGGTKRYPIANFGVPGLQPRDYLEITRLVLDKYSPKTILLSLYLGNDFPQMADLNQLVEDRPKSENPVSRHFISRFALFRLFNNLKRVLSVPSNQRNIAAVSKETLPLEAGTCRPLNSDELKLNSRPTFQSTEWYKIVNTEAGRFYPGLEAPENLTRVKQKLIEPLSEIADLCHRRGIRLIAILSPSQFALRSDLRSWFFQKRKLEGKPLKEENFDLDLPSKVTGRILSNLGVEFIDLMPSFRDRIEKDPQHPYYAPGDTHWNERGNIAAAEIAGNLLKPFLCKP